MAINARAVSVQGIGFAAISVATLGWLTPSEVVGREVGVGLQTVTTSLELDTATVGNVECESDVVETIGSIKTTTDLSKS
jgi:hypothetical protein